jgi:arsenite methyltransferase
MATRDLAKAFSWRDAFMAGEPDAIAAYDEAPLWSAPFGQALLEAVRMLPGQKALDIGCGTGFPSLELASRLGRLGEVVGLDPQSAQLERARFKAKVREIPNITFVEGVAEKLPFEDGRFDLVVSNNGLNNVADPVQALAECHRVTQTRAQLVFTANLPDTFDLFYTYWEGLLEECRTLECIQLLRDHRAAKRKPTEAWVELVEKAGFQVWSTKEHSFRWSFIDGTALFSHPSIRLGFLQPWIDVLGEERAKEFLPFLEGRLNRLGLERGGLHLDVPFLCLDARRY